MLRGSVGSSLSQIHTLCFNFVLRDLFGWLDGRVFPWQGDGSGHFLLSAQVKVRGLHTNLHSIYGLPSKIPIIT